jgi:hypothetical protein
MLQNAQKHHSLCYPAQFGPLKAHFHNQTSKHKRMVVLLKKLGIYEIVDLGLMTVEQALESSFFTGNKMEKSDMKMTSLQIFVGIPGHCPEVKKNCFFVEKIEKSLNQGSNREE